MSDRRSRSTIYFSRSNRRSRFGQKIFQMAIGIGIGIGIAISIFNEDRDRNLNFGDRDHALGICTFQQGTLIGVTQPPPKEGTWSALFFLEEVV